TAQAIVYMAAVSLLYAAAVREFRERTWRRRLAVTVVATGVVLTLVGLVQAASPDPRKIYGLWKPSDDWAVFGPYENRNHFGAYLVMAIPIAAGLAVEAARATARAWRHRRRAVWLALLDGPGPTIFWWMAAAA